jgi:FkbM family methyltransferase
MGIVNALIRLAKPLVERVPFLAHGYRNWRDGRYRDAEPQQTPLGFRFTGNHAMQTGTFEPEETALIRRLLGDVDIVINVGANIGYYCCISLQAGKEVIAFEPMPANLRYLLRNIRANNWDDRCEVYPMAVGDRVGVLDMFGAGTGTSLVRGWAGVSDRYSTPVPGTTLDRVLAQRIQGRKCLFIVDIEGAERLMLSGATAILAMEPKPRWVVEISVAENQPRGVAINPHLASTFEVFWRNGYEARTADAQCRAVNAQEVDRVATTGVDTLGTQNFLFFERGLPPC